MKRENTEHGPPVVQITYYGDDEPKVLVKAPAGLDVIVELIDGEEARWLFLDYNGVKVYVTYQERHGKEYLSTDWFNPRRAEGDENDDSFDADDLPEVPVALRSWYEQRFPVTAEMKEWECITAERKQCMAYAIDAELLTDDGLAEKPETRRL